MARRTLRAGLVAVAVALTVLATAPPASAKGIAPWTMEVSDTSVAPGEVITITLEFEWLDGSRPAGGEIDPAIVDQQLEIYPVSELEAAMAGVRGLREELGIPVHFEMTAPDEAEAEVAVPDEGEWAIVPLPWEYERGVAPHAGSDWVPEPVRVSVGQTTSGWSWFVPVLPALIGLPLAAMAFAERRRLTPAARRPSGG